MNNDIRSAASLFNSLDAEKRKLMLVILRELASSQESSACSDRKEKNKDE